MKLDQAHTESAVEATQSPGQAGRPNGTTTIFRIPNMDCRNEEAAIRARLATLTAVDSLSFDLPQRRLTVRHGLPTSEPLLEALHEIGMHASLDDEGEAAGNAACGAACSGSCVAGAGMIGGLESSGTNGGPRGGKRS